MIRNSISVLGLCGLLSLASPVQAQDAMQVRVAVDDLNLRSDAGTDVLLRRLEGAASRICGGDFPRDLNRLAASEKCRHDLTAMVEGTGEVGPLLDLSASIRKSAPARP